MGAQPAPGLDVTVDLSQMRALFAQLKAAEGKLQVEFRREITHTTDDLVKKAKAAASWSSTIPPQIKATASFTARNTGVSIRVNSTKARHARPYENGGRTGTFRHPVHARPDQSRDEWTWVSEAARPFFFTNVSDIDAVQAACAKAVDTWAASVGFK